MTTTPLFARPRPASTPAPALSAGQARPAALFDPLEVAARFSWLRDDSRTDPSVLAHLAAENAATDAALAPLAGLQAEILTQLMAFVDGVDERSVRIPDGTFEYWTARPAGASYESTWRRVRAQVTGTAGADELVLDPAELAREAGADDLDVSDAAVSDDHRLLAWAQDACGGERWDIVVREIGSSTDILRVTSGDDASWADTVLFDASGEHLLLLELDTELRPWRVVSVNLASSERCVLLTEPDAEFWLDARTTADNRFVVVSSASTDSSEEYLIDRLDVHDSPVLVSAREPGVRYQVDMLADERHPQYVARVDVSASGAVVASPTAGPASTWPVLLAPPAGVTIDAVTARAGGHLLLDVHAGPVPAVAVLHRDCEHALHDGGLELLPAPVDGVVAVTLIELPDPASTTVWVSASGYSMPETVFVRPLCDSDAPWVRVHQDSVPAGLDLSVYESGWDTATSADGTTVPLSWVRRPGVPVTGVLLYGYGAYGLDYPPELAVSWLAMADRGVVCVNANVRGGGELGTSWHDAGRLERKPRSFEDFLACAARSRELFGTDKVVAWGGSAGGLLVAASLNADPAAFAGVVAEVPFVDCLATMSDPTLPLVVADYVEWGNPADPVIRDVIASYTPVRNVRAAAYPPVLAVCGLHDPRVSYWEPATWVQVLRAGSTSGAPALLRVEDGGHSGAASLAVSCAQRAQKVAFALACLTGVLPQA